LSLQFVIVFPELANGDSPRTDAIAAREDAPENYPPGADRRGACSGIETGRVAGSAIGNRGVRERSEPMPPPRIGDRRAVPRMAIGAHLTARRGVM